MKFAIGADRSLPVGHDTLLLQQTARDPLHTLSHRHDNIWAVFGEPVISTRDNILIEFHLPESNAPSPFKEKVEGVASHS